MTQHNRNEADHVFVRVDVSTEMRCDRCGKEERYALPCPQDAERFVEAHRDCKKSEHALRVLVCGSRDFKSARMVFLTLNHVHETEGIACVIHGGCRGADRMANEWAWTNSVNTQVFVADWSQGRSAGPRRNATMLADGKPDVCIAFGDGKGTRDMVRRCEKAGVPVRRYTAHIIP